MSEQNQSSETPVQSHADVGHTQASSSNVNLDDYVPKTSVEAIVKQEKSKAYEQGRKAALTVAEQSGSKADVSAPMTSSNSDKKTAEADDEVFKAKVDHILQQRETAQAEKAQVQHREQAVHQLVQELTPKIQRAQQKHADYDAVVGRINFAEQAPVVLLAANSVDDAGDVLYELAKQPAKLFTLAQMPIDLARQEVAKLSQSLQARDGAANDKAAVGEPLDQLQSSNVAGSDNGQRNVQDFKRMPTYRV